jgi:glycerol kinase
MEIFENVKRCMSEAFRRAEEVLGTKPVIRGLGVTNQRETAVAWSKATGKPLTNAVVWMDTRTRCDLL